MKTKKAYETMLAIAMPVVELIRPVCEEVEIAGSLRRKCAEVGDIEILASPREYKLDMFDMSSVFHSLDEFDWSSLGLVKLNGHKQKRIILPGEVQLDLFIVTPPAQWGIKLVLATGSKVFNHKFVTKKQYGGLMPAHLKMVDGRVVSNHSGKVVDTPTEKDVFALWGMKYLTPEERDWK